MGRVKGSDCDSTWKDSPLPIPSLPRNDSKQHKDLIMTDVFTTGVLEFTSYHIIAVHDAWCTPICM